MTDSRKEWEKAAVQISTIDRVSNVLTEYAPAMLANRPIAEGLSLRRDLELDSLALVSVLVRLGDGFGIEMSDQEFDLADIETVGDLATLVEQLALSATNGNIGGRRD